MEVFVEKIADLELKGLVRAGWEQGSVTGRERTWSLLPAGRDEVGE